MPLAGTKRVYIISQDDSKPLIFNEKRHGTQKAPCRTGGHDCLWAIRPRDLDDSSQPSVARVSRVAPALIQADG